MKKIKSMRIVLLTMAFMALLAGTVFAGPQDFTLENNTGRDILNVYVSQTSTNSWGSDIMGQDYLANGSSVFISFDSSAYRDWDIMVEFVNGGSQAYYDIDLYSTYVVTLNPGGTATIR